jgi:hypothetical protein
LFTAFFLQIGLVVHGANSLAQLQWFLGVLTPRAADSSIAIADPKGKGKAKRKPTQEKPPARDASRKKLIGAVDITRGGAT